MPKKTFNNIDDALSPENKTRVNKIIETVVNELWAKDTIYNPSFTLHGPPHSRQVIRILQDILAIEHQDIRDFNKLINPNEVFYLLAAAWLHDVGMVLKPSNAEVKKAHLAKQPIDKWMRNEHHRRSNIYIKSNYRDLGLKQTEADIIGRICQGHRKDDLFSKDYPEGNPNIRFLAALLRFADELDITSERAPEKYMYEHWEEFDDESRWHWVKHWCVREAVARHENDLEADSPKYTLSYIYRILLPDLKFEIPLQDKILMDLKDEIKEPTLAIIENKKLSISLRRFEWIPVIIDDRMIGNNFPIANIEFVLDQVLRNRPSIPDHIDSYIQNNFSTIPPLSLILQKQLDYLVNFASINEFQDFSAKSIQLLSDFIKALEKVDDPSSIDQTYLDIKHKSRRLHKNESSELVSSLKREWDKYYVLLWRARTFLTGIEEKKRFSFEYITETLQDEANTFTEWVFKNEEDRELRLKAIERLVNNYSSKFNNTIFDASKDPDPYLRKAAIKAFLRISGPKSYQRLSEIIGADLDGDVRSTAVNVLGKIKPKTAVETKQNWNRKKILILNEMPYVVPPLVDGLTPLGITVKVEHDYDKVLDLLSSWKPDRIFYIYTDIINNFKNKINFDQLQYVYILLERKTKIIFASDEQNHVTSSNLASINATYVRLPAETEILIYAILLSL